ncbi:MAG: DsbA family oxidoreductase [Anaerolineae bacterium]|nr:DsbA family oxidoreductase [Anaerolineae bacterium]
MRIDIFHDTVCPWCRIGKQHLKLALEQWTGEPAEIHYHTFFLNSDIPTEGYPFREYMHAKGGGRIPLEQFFDAPRQAGAKVGLTFNFEAITHAPNSLLSHQLIVLTPENQREAMIDALYAAYFEHGQDIGKLDVLVDVAHAQGFDGDVIRAKLEAGEGKQAVLDDADQAHRLGINGVPFFVFNNRLAFSGAQPISVMLDVLKQSTTIPTK